MSNKPPKIILASTSPRRSEILKLLQIPFQVVAPRFEEESLSELSPYDEALRFSLEKAKSIIPILPSLDKERIQGRSDKMTSPKPSPYQGEGGDSIIIGSDTLLEFEGEKIGKPKDPHHAREILKKLRGNTHDILTGVCVMNTQNKDTESTVEIIQTKMRNYCEDEIEIYVASAEAMDKAGAYALQGKGRFLIESLHGDYLAAVGLPLRFIAQALERFGIKIPIPVEKIYREKKFMNWGSY